MQFPLVPRTPDQVPYLLTFLQNKFPKLLAFDFSLTTGVDDGDGLGEVDEVRKLAEGWGADFGEHLKLGFGDSVKFSSEILGGYVLTRVMVVGSELFYRGMRQM